VTEAANRAWRMYGRPVPSPDELRARAEASIPRSQLGQDPDTDVATLVSSSATASSPGPPGAASSTSPAVPLPTAVDTTSRAAAMTHGARTHGASGRLATVPGARCRVRLSGRRTTGDDDGTTEL